MGSECLAFECDRDRDFEDEWYLEGGDRDLDRDLFLCFFFFFSFSSSLGRSLFLLEGLSETFISRAGNVLTLANRAHGMLLTDWKIKLPGVSTAFMAIECILIYEIGKFRSRLALIHSLDRL